MSRPVAKIPAWKFAGGLMLHVSVPVFLATLAAIVLWHLTVHPFSSLAATILRSTSIFLAADAVLTGSVTGLALLWDKLTDLKANSRAAAATGQPAQVSKANREAGLQAFAALSSDQDIAALVTQLGQARWNHDDQLFQELARDLARAGATIAGAAKASSPAQDAELTDAAVMILHILIERAHDLHDESRTASLSQAQAMAGYFASKYGGGRGTPF